MPDVLADPTERALLAPPAVAVAPAARARRARASLREWLVVVLVALGAALALRTLVFEAYRIPSTSMEGTLLVGDLVFVSKLHYGPRLPLALGGGEARRLPGFSAWRRGDVVVFNYPPEPERVDRKTPYIKRVVGLPGDTVRISRKMVFVNGALEPEPDTGRQLWRVRTDGPGALPYDELAEADATLQGGHGSESLVEATPGGARRLAAHPGVRAVTAFVRRPDDGSAGFPATHPFSLDDFGPVVVPRRGLTVRLDDRSWPLYREAIARERAAGGGEAPRRVAGGFEIEGALTDRYTFRQDHLFVLGDNRDDSADSRSWGFVPADHVVGKAVMVYFSYDRESPGLPWWRRWRTDRFLHPVR